MLTCRCKSKVFQKQDQKQDRWVIKTKVYLDLIFLQNFFLDYLLLTVTGKLMQRQAKGLRLMAAALLGSSMTVLYYLLGGFLIAEKTIPGSLIQLLNLFLAYCMLIIAFRPLRGIERVLYVFVLYALSFAMEGFLSWLQGRFPALVHNRFRVLAFLGAAWFGSLFLKQFIEIMKERSIEKHYNCPVMIEVAGHMARGRGLLDSGNSLTEPISARPVVVVEQQFLQDNGIAIPTEGYFAIPYHAVGCDRGILKGFLADEVHIIKPDGERILKKVMLGVYEGRLSREGQYQVLLHPKL